MRYLLLLLISSTAFSQPALIPQPHSIQTLKGQFTLTKQTILSYNTQEAKDAALLLNEYLQSNYSFKLPVRQQKTGAISIEHDPSATAESYTLQIQPSGIKLKGNAAGLFYGIQTLQQLFPANKLTLPALSIKDQPRFKYRGLMLDVCRHFYSVAYIKKFLDQMSHYKLNNFHWHLTDDQGWRIEIKKYPALQTTAAWRDESGTKYGGYYTQEQAKEIVAYAAKRFINVIPEIEMPGHSCAALAAYPGLGCTGGPYNVQPSWGIFKDVYCAGNDSVFNFLQGVIDEVTEIFPGQYIHVGGDETPKDRWKQCAKCQARMKKEGLKDEHELQSYFVQRMEKYINSKGRKMIGWDEILEGGLAPNATVMSWRGEKGGMEAARLKHDVIMSPYTYLYFDYYQGKPATEPKAIGGYLPIPAVYAYEPMGAGFTKEEQPYIKGIQANIWTEFIADEKHLDYMIFPRALIVAETGWGPRNKNYDQFMKKLRVRLQALDRQPVNFRIPEPIGLKDSISNSSTITINLQPTVQGATILYSIDGAEPTRQLNGPIKLTLPVVLKTITVLPSGRKSAVYSASYKKADPRIEWDSTTMRKVSANGIRYSGYARLIVLPDNSWLCTYEADGSTVVSKSTDKGLHWSEPVVVAARGDGYNMAVPDLLLLKDGSILSMYNPRPFQNSPERKFAIRTKKSYDGGLTWKDERLLYEAGHEFKNGCWEPCALQLPNGEIQLYFANEGPYTKSEEQNISMLRSTDNGLTWSKAANVSFRAGSRDGMPVPVLLNNGKEIVFAIEDNGSGNFKPYIIRNTLKENWAKPVLANDKNRQYALSEKIPDSIYAGAPYLRQLPGGETILSYQGTEGRINNMRHAEMKVVIGSASATNFGKKSSPFPIPPSRSGLWNSLSVIDNNTIVALTSTNGLSDNRATEVWMIIGHVKR